MGWQGIPYGGGMETKITPVSPVKREDEGMGLGELHAEIRLDTSPLAHAFEAAAKAALNLALAMYGVDTWEEYEKQKRIERHMRRCAVRRERRRRKGK